jgi:formate hydrogenlyase subunit 6/NADH:ubiquinone oxidoreductase subunit I
MNIIKRTDIDSLFKVLQQKGYDIIGPAVADGAIVYDHIESADDLPQGWGDEQAPGQYRLKKRNDQALFGYVVGPTSWKKFLFQPNQKLWQADRNGAKFDIQVNEEPITKKAFLGVRACELAAIGIQDKVFLGGDYVDSHYQRRRSDVLLITVNCTEPGGTCFCVSMDTGPKAEEGFDLSLTEVIDKEDHYFVVSAGTSVGEEILNDIPHQSAEPAQINKEKALIEEARGKMGRTLDTNGVKELLYQNAEHPQWEDVAQRCLACANCTMACPTCFCSSVEEVTDLTGDHVERWRRWDSCFTSDFSYIHGGHVRKTAKGRYRQWMTHKLASWKDQFGSSGCVGCGRCITWCPVGIDITQEVKSIREQPLAQPADVS